MILKPNFYINLCESRAYKDSETHNKAYDKTKNLKIKFMTEKSRPTDNLVPKNQKYWKLNLDPLFIVKQEPKIYKDVTKSLIHG